MAKTVCQACRGYDLERQWCDRCKGAGYEEAAQPAESSDSRDDDAEFRAWREQQWSAGINPTERDAWMERARRERDLLVSVATPAVDYTAQQQAEPVGDEEVQRVLNRLNSSDPEFDDCADAAALIVRMATEMKGPDGYATWKAAAIAERRLRVAAQSGQRAGVAEDTARLDWVLANDAFMVWTKRDGAILQCQVYTQDEDEEYHVLSGDARYFNTPREAIDAAMLAAAPTPAAQGDQS